MAQLDVADPQTYGEKLAGIYDDWIVQLQDDAEEAVAFLAKLAGDTAPQPLLLELGVGTGRIALPLSASGLAVTGVDASEQMLDRLRAKPGSDKISLVVGDFSALGDIGSFDVVFAVFNTFLSLTSQDAQVACFASAAEQLAPGGAFVLQMFVPDVARFEMAQQSGQRMEVARAGEESLTLGMAKHDPVTQRLWPQYGMQSDNGTTDYSVQFRYVWPSELDLMARLAGLTLERRMAAWDGETFTGTSPSHVSIYRKPAA